MMTKEQTAEQKHRWYLENKAKRSAYHKEWYAKNRDRILAEYKVKYPKRSRQRKETENTRTRRRWAEVKAKVIAGYGGKCECCGETTPAFLTVDHIGGLKGQKRVASFVLYPRLVKQGFPRDGYRLLCMNCNWGSRYHHVCPHRLSPVVS